MTTLEGYNLSLCHAHVSTSFPTPSVSHDTTLIAQFCRCEVYWQRKSHCGLRDSISAKALLFRMASDNWSLWQVSANYTNFVEIVQDWFNEEDLSEVYVEINFNKLIFTGYNDANSELSEAQESKCYSRESSLPHEGNSCTSFFLG